MSTHAIENFAIEIYKTVDIMDWQDQAESINVSDETQARHALSMSLQTRKIKKALDESRKEITKPHLDFQRAINKMAKDVESALEKIESGLHEKVATWMEKQQGDALTQIDKIEVEDGAIYYDESYDFAVIDEENIPGQYYTVNYDLIREDIKNGIRSIPGLQITKTATTKLRIKN